jgi:hypothetical protein
LLEHEKLHSDICFILQEVAPIGDLYKLSWVQVFSLYESQLEKIKKQAEIADKMKFRNG